MSIRKILLSIWNARVSMISIGRSKQDCTGEMKKILSWLASLIGKLPIVMSFWVLRKDCVLLLSQIDATLHWLRLWVCIMVDLQQDQQVQEKPKQLRILVEVWVFSWLSPIVQINRDIEIWLKSSKDWCRVDCGDASMSSIEFYCRYYQWWLCRLSVLDWLRNNMYLNSCSPKNNIPSESDIQLVTSSPWTQVMLDVNNFPKTWRCCSEVSLWWCQIDRSLSRWSWHQWVTSSSMYWVRSSTCCTFFVKNSSPNKDIMTSVWGTSWPC